MEYDKIIYTSLSVPKRCTQPGIEHWKQLSASEQLHSMWGKISEEEWGRVYENELRTILRPELQKLIDLSNKGMWIQVLFFEEKPTEGERPWMYNVLKEIIPDVYIE